MDGPIFYTKGALESRRDDLSRFIELAKRNRDVSLSRLAREKIIILYSVFMMNCKSALNLCNDDVIL